MSLPPDVGFALAKSVFQVLYNVTAIILKAKEDQRSGQLTRLSNSEVINQMGPAAHARAVELRNEIQQMKLTLAQLRDMGFQVDLPLAEVRIQSWFYKVSPLAPHKLLRNFSARVEAITIQAGHIFSDIVAVVNCREGEDEMVAAMKNAKQDFGYTQDQAYKQPLSELVEILLKEAEGLVALTNGL